MSGTSFEAELRQVEPALRLVPERRLRKLLHYLRDHGRAIPLNPGLPLWIARADVIAADVLPPTVLEGTEDPLFFVTFPDDRLLGSLPREEQLRQYWRLLFRSSVLAAVDARLASGSLTPALCEERLARFGPAAAREIRYVLEMEHRVDPQADAAAVFRSFAATFLDLHFFQPEACAAFFPTLPEAKLVAAQLRHDVDGETLHQKSRPAGAANRTHEPTATYRRNDPTLDGSECEAIFVEAVEAEGDRNFVRAAILMSRLHEAAIVNGLPARGAARRIIDKLVRNLARILNWDEPTQIAWQRAIMPLLEPAATGRWPRAARCLYELQRIVADFEREVFAVDLVEPIRTLGRRPIKRPLPHAREVMLLLKLRTAQKHLLRSGVEERTREPLDHAFHQEMHRLERAIRHKLAPIAAAALRESGFQPTNRVEEVAFDKLVAELLDRVCERGYLRFGDLRDAVARNQLKMPDLAGPGELLAGDSLLRADTRLAYDLDGIYRRGEFYLRFLQRGSSVFFGTAPGRWLFLYLIAPFLASFLILTFAIEIEHIAGNVRAFAAKILAPRPEVVERVVEEYDWDSEGNLVSVDSREFVSVARQVVTASQESALPTWEPVFVFGIFLLLVFHVPPFRRMLFSVLGGLARTLLAMFWEVPKQVLTSPAVTAIRYSAPVRMIGRLLLGSMLFATAIVALLWFLGAAPERMLRWGGIAFAAAALALNTPWGLGVQERLAASVADGWRILRVNLLPGVVATLLDWFRRFANWFERKLYAVDEWLRYRGGDSRRSLAAKAAIGLFWFPFAYFARFAFNLLIEPQINPVKHFPVVTVSHKVLLPLVFSDNPKSVPSIFGKVLVDHLGMSVSAANFWGFWIIAGIPGIFGFIAWELLANWRLYAANRPERLKPVVIGSHGESVRGLLRPGFHSGTAPRWYRKLRRAIERGRHSAATRCRHELEHAVEGMHRFLEREWIALLQGDREANLRPVVERIRLGCQRVEVELAASELGPDALVLSWENRGGKIAAAIEQPGWLDKLTAPQRGVVLGAIRGLWDMGAAEIGDGRDRTPDADPPGEANLLRPFTWSEWCARWNGQR